MSTAAAIPATSAIAPVEAAREPVQKPEADAVAAQPISPAVVAAPAAPAANDPLAGIVSDVEAHAAKEIAARAAAQSISIGNLSVDLKLVPQATAHACTGGPNCAHCSATKAADAPQAEASAVPAAPAVEAAAPAVAPETAPAVAPATPIAAPIAEASAAAAPAAAEAVKPEAPVVPAPVAQTPAPAPAIAVDQPVGASVPASLPVVAPTNTVTNPATVVGQGVVAANNEHATIQAGAAR